MPPASEPLEGLHDVRTLLHACRALPDPHYTDSQWEVLVALLTLLPLAVAELKRLFAERGLTDHNEKVQSVLDTVKATNENWLLTWTMQELHSIRETAGKKGLWNSEPPRQVFHVNTDDVDCAAQGVSALERYALVPHGAYQATFAKGYVDDIFKDYRCYISSGEHILRHV